MVWTEVVKAASSRRPKLEHKIVCAHRVKEVGAQLVSIKLMLLIKSRADPTHDEGANIFGYVLETIRWFPAFSWNTTQPKQKRR